MRILFVTQWFEPEAVMKGADFARALAAEGNSVEVLTGFPNYPEGKLYPGYRLRPWLRETLHGLSVNRVWLYPSHDGSAARRALNYGSFFLSALLWGLINGGRFDVVYVYHPPITPAVATALFTGLWGKPFVLDVQDLWPDSVRVSGMDRSGLFSRIVGALCGFVYRRAAQVIAQSAGMKSALATRGASPERLTIVYNWGDETGQVPRGRLNLAPFGFEGRFTFVYGGNLGRVQALDVLIRAAARAHATDPRIQLLLVGGGMEAEALKTLAAEIAPDCVRVHPPVSRGEIGDVFKAADVLVLHLADEPLFAFTIPSKIQAYLLSGRPILVGVRGEAAAIVTDAGAGRSVTPDDPVAMCEAMLAMARTGADELAAMGARARAAYERNFSFAAAMRKTSAVVGAASARSPVN